MNENINDLFEVDVPKEWDLMSPVRQEGETSNQYAYRMRVMKEATKLFKQGRIVSMQEHIQEKNENNKR